MRTMYYSDITNKNYDTQAECVAAEMKFKIENAKMRREFERIKKQAEEATKKDNRTELRNNLIEAMKAFDEAHKKEREAFNAYSEVDEEDASMLLLKRISDLVSESFNKLTDSDFEEDEDND